MKIVCPQPTASDSLKGLDLHGVKKNQPINKMQNILQTMQFAFEISVIYSNDCGFFE